MADGPTLRPKSMWQLDCPHPELELELICSSVSNQLMDHFVLINSFVVSVGAVVLFDTLAVTI